MINLAQYSYNYNYGNTAMMQPETTGIFFVFLFIFLYAILIAYAVLHCIALYNWGTSDAKYFEDGLSGKKTWFWIMTFVPFGLCSTYLSFVQKLIARRRLVQLKIMKQQLQVHNNLLTNLCKLTNLIEV